MNEYTLRVHRISLYRPTAAAIRQLSVKSLGMCPYYGPSHLQLIAFLEELSPTSDISTFSAAILDFYIF